MLKKETPYGHIEYLIVADELQIIDIATKQEFQRQGHAEQLLQHIIIEAQQQQCQNAYLEVRISNHAAINLYKKIGFTPSGLRRNYYTKPTEDALLLKLRLTN